MIPAIETQPEEMNPDFLTLVIQVLLLRLGGQQVVSCEELLHSNHTYIGTRFTTNKYTGEIIMTLRSRESGMDPG